MRSLLILLIAFLIPLLTISQNNSGADNCEKTRLGVSFNDLGDIVLDHLNEKYGTKSLDAWLDDIDDRVVQTLQNNSPELDVFSRRKNKSKDPHYIFTYGLHLNIIETDLIIPSEANTYIDPDLGWEVTEYSDPVYEEETAFWNYGSLMINSPCIPNYRAILAVDFVKDLELDGAITGLSQRFWRITNLIEESEEERPVPAKGPVIEIDYEKEYLSILEKEDREMEVKVKVKNCKGAYLYSDVESQPVYFPKDVNRCEFSHVVDCEDRGMYGNSYVILTNKQYEAKGKYKVIEGLEASNEKVNLGSCGIGSNSEVYKEGELIIRGLEIKVKPNRRQIFCDERTEIKLTFNETDPDGNNYPVEGKDLNVKINGLINGTIKAKDGYTTDENGEVILNYKAGDDDKKISITASYQPVDYPDKADGKASVTVKPLEYDATLTLKKKFVKRVTFNKEESKTGDDCNTNTKKKRQFNETIESTIYVTLKLIESTDMPMYNQRWEYYEPINVDLSTFNLFSNDNRLDFSNSTGYDCASGGYETTTTTKKQIRKKEIEGKGQITTVPWIVTFDNETGKALKIIPAGYGVAYEYDETEKFHTSTWSKDDKSEDSGSDTKTSTRTFGVGPVEDPKPDPTAKSSGQWIQDYIKKNIGDIPPEIAVQIPKTDPKEAQNDINPDVIVQFGDGKKYFGGNGRKSITTPNPYGFEQIEQVYTWQMTRRRKDQ